MEIFGDAGVNGLVPADAQATSLPIGINDIEGQQTDMISVGMPRTFRFRCNHCGQPYNILALSVFKCVHCENLHKYQDAVGPCMIFGCIGSTHWEYDINLDGTPA